MTYFNECMKKAAELIPVDGRKSFYGKAKVFKDDNIFYLVSYNTIVASYDDINNIFVKHWDGYSCTTMRHINSFMRFIGFNLGGKAFWDKIEYNKNYNISDLLNII